MDGTFSGALVGLVTAAVLAVLGIFGRRYEGRETRAVSTQAAVIDDLESSNARLRIERDEARVLLAEERADHVRTSLVLWNLEEQFELPHRRATDVEPPVLRQRRVDDPIVGRRRTDRE